jgi:hypothetical protein
MKLKTILDQMNLRQEPSSMDLDVSTRLGPTISQHLTALEALCKLLPNCIELQEKLNEIKGLFAASVPLQSNVLEASSRREDYPVVYEYDPSKPIEQQRLAVIGGAGSYTMESLDTKVRREFDELSHRIDEIQTIKNYADRGPSYRKAQHIAGILENHLLTMVVGINQIEEKSTADEMEESSETMVDEGLRDLAASWWNKGKTYIFDRLPSNISIGQAKAAYIDLATQISLAIDEYPDQESLKEPHAITKIVDRVMKKILPNLDPKMADKARHAIDTTVKTAINGITQTGRLEIIIPVVAIIAYTMLKHRTNETDDDMDDQIRSAHVMEMYETMSPGMGDKAWVAITKRLKAEGYDADLVERMINRAIILKGS